MRWLRRCCRAGGRVRSGDREHIPRRSRLLVGAGVTAILVSGVLGAGPTTSALASARTKVNAFGELDCNGYSPIQHVVKPTLPCTDIRGLSGVANANTWGGRFYDNSHYIGHDEPDMTFLSSKPGSGNSVTWKEILGSDPGHAPTVRSPGSDVSHWFELSVAPWFSMAECDPLSYPQNPCTPKSDTNAPACSSASELNGTCNPSDAGAGSAFMEMQFYPPGFAPFDDAISCDNSHWCAALTIDSLECTLGFAQCNLNCEEPVNFAWIQTNGVPTGPPSPQNADLATFTPNSHTLLMSPGDHITVTMADARVPKRRASAFRVTIDDLTTGHSGFMQASALNGFQDTSISDCSGTPFNFQPEYNTAGRNNIIPWAALQTDISTEFEIGHFEACTNVTKPSRIGLSPTVTDTFWNNCTGPYEKTAPGGDGHKKAEVSDALCYPAGDTHGSHPTGMPRRGRDPAPPLSSPSPPPASGELRSTTLSRVAARRHPPHLVSEYDYGLPAEQVAQTPLAERDASRLLVIEGGQLADRRFTHLPDLLRRGDLLIANETRVRAARLRGRREGGGFAELLVLGRDGDGRFTCLTRPARRLAVGTVVDLGDGLRAHLEGAAMGGHPGARLVSFEGADDPEAAIERLGAAPLPPYIRRPLGEPERYQTVYAAGPPVSAAAPTAGLHFTDRILERLTERGIGWSVLRLEVGLATFRPMTAERVRDHVMPEERFEIAAATAERIAAARAAGARIVAVGTTAVRALESAASEDGVVAAGEGVTRLFIRPGHRFRVVDGMVTNFHQPRSSLLVLVAALVGPAWKRAYAHALLGGYRFLSFGDCMLAWGAPCDGDGRPP